MNDYDQEGVFRPDALWGAPSSPRAADMIKAPIEMAATTPIGSLGAMRRKSAHRSLVCLRKGSMHFPLAVWNCPQLERMEPYGQRCGRTLDIVGERIQDSA